MPEDPKDRLSHTVWPYQHWCQIDGLRYSLSAPLFVELSLAGGFLSDKRGSFYSFTFRVQELHAARRERTVLFLANYRKGDLVGKK